MQNKKLAILDLGTNTFHLMLAEVQGSGAYQIFFNEKIPVMIGKQGISHGFISDEAQQRAISALQQFKQKIERAGIRQVQATATSAFRNAKNGTQLAEKIKVATDIEIQIIDGEQEATYIYMGVQEALSLTQENALIVDIGGGSVEFILCNKQGVLWKKSMEIGAQRLLDRFCHTDPMALQDIQQLQEYLEQQLTTLHAACQQYPPQVLIGASGAFETLSEIHAHREGISLTEDQTEMPLTYDSFLAIHQHIIHKNREERLQIPGMIAMRVDMIVVASLLVDYLLHRFQIQKIRVSAYALKEGLLRHLSDQAAGIS